MNVKNEVVPIITVQLGALYIFGGYLFGNQILFYLAKRE